MKEADLIKMSLEIIVHYKKNIEIWNKQIKLYPSFKDYYEKQISIDEKNILDIIETYPKIKKYINLL